MVDQPNGLGRELRTPRAAAVAGIVFAVLLTVAVAFLQKGLPPRTDPTRWLSNPSNRRSVAVSMTLIPYAGIAFLWFIGVIRARLGEREDKLFATAFLGSGLLFVAMLFTAAAVTGAVLDLYGTGRAVSSDDVRLASSLASTLLATFGIRMAAVFTLVTTNLGRLTGFVPRWLVVVGFATAAILLLSPPRTVWATLLFPAWVSLLSVDILVKSLRAGDETAPTT